MRIAQLIMMGLLAAGLAAAGGCQTTTTTTTSSSSAVPPALTASSLTHTQKEAAQKEWADARAGVLGTLAQDQYRNGNFDKCQATLDEALRMEPTNAPLHLLGAKLAIEQGDLELAERHLDAAKKADPKNPEADYLDGVVLQRWQQPQAAYTAYDAAAQKNPQELSYLMAKAEMLVVLGKPADALELLQERVSYFEHSAAIRDAVGQLLVQQGRAAEGAAMLQQASLLAGEDDAIVREHLAFALFQAKQYPEAAEQFQRLLRADSKDQNLAKRADVYAALGECDRQCGRLNEARESLVTATEIDSTSAGYWLALSRVALQMNDLPRADSAARRALAVDATDAAADCLLGYVRLRESKLADSLSAFAAACRLDPSDTVSLCMQGYLLQKMGDAPRASACYAAALRSNPHDELANQLMRPDGVSR